MQVFFCLIDRIRFLYGKFFCLCVPNDIRVKKLQIKKYIKNIKYIIWVPLDSPLNADS